MHELALSEGVLRTLCESAKTAGYSRVKTIWLEIGELAGVERSALLFCFDAVSKGSLADGARLEIIVVAGEAWCMQCAKAVKVKQRFDQCPDCDSYQLQLTGGDEMRIKELEVE